MATINLNEQILFLRKQKGLTQEELANALGVTNQAVSKWESSQCCPDIQLLPTIAELFETSVDELLGYTPASTAQDLTLSLRRKINSLSDEEGFAFAFRMAAALHTIILSKYMGKEADPNHSWDTDEVVKNAGNGQWGYSCVYDPMLITTMRHGTLFFSNNENTTLTRDEIRRLTSVIRPFADPNHLKTAAALYQLTVHSEKSYAVPAQISEACGLSEEQVSACLNGNLNQFILESDNPSDGYRFKGMYMNLIPVLSLLDLEG